MSNKVLGRVLTSNGWDKFETVCDIKAGTWLVSWGADELRRLLTDDPICDDNCVVPCDAWVMVDGDYKTIWKSSSYYLQLILFLFYTLKE